MEKLLVFGRHFSYVGKKWKKERRAGISIQVRVWRTVHFWVGCALALCTVINKYTVLYLADFTDSSMHRKPFSDAPLPLYVALNISDTEGACLNVNVI